MKKLSNALYIENDIQNDNINPALINDLKTASDYIQKNGNKNFYTVITSAQSDHKTFVKGSKTVKSRHASGLAIDIANISNVTFRSNPQEFKRLGDMLVNVLKSMGYEQVTSEKGVEKTILWQTTDHYNHIHVSNTTKSQSSAPSADLISTSGVELSSTAQGDASGADNEFKSQFRSDPALSMFRAESRHFFTKKTIMESLLREDFFGKRESEANREITIPARHNDYLTFPFESGVVVRSISNSCNNELTISFNKNKNKVQYCGFDRTYFTKGSTVTNGDKIGRVGSDDITIKLFDSNNRQIKFSDIKIESDDEEKTKKDKEVKPKNTKKFISATANVDYEPDLLNSLKKFFGFKSKKY